MDLRPISEMQQKGFLQMYFAELKEAYTHDWVFCGWEKLIVFGCFLWTCFSVFRFVWGMFV